MFTPNIMPKRATRTAITQRTAEDTGGGAKRTRLGRRGRRRGTNNTTKEAGMGAATSLQPGQNVSPSQENITSPKPVCLTSYTQTPALPEEPDLRRKCPHCSSVLKPVLDSAGRSTSLLQCPVCPAGGRVCEQCLYPSTTTTCANKSCQLVSMLLTCEQVTDPSSKVKGCPVFRSCPKCHCLMMHSGGCKYMICSNCSHTFCFICLQSTEECKADTKKYWSLTCNKPRAARQRFKT